MLMALVGCYSTDIGLYIPLKTTAEFLRRREECEEAEQFLKLIFQ